MTEKPRETYPKEKRSIIPMIARFLGIFFLISILLLILAVFAFDYYLQSNKIKIFEQLTFLNNGSISFEEAEISVYKNFPSATITLHNLQVKDSLFSQHQVPFLKASEFRAALSLDKLWEQEVELKSIELHDGQLNFHTDRTGYNLLKSLIPEPSNPNDSLNKNNQFKDFKLRRDQINVSLFNVYVRFTHAINKSSIQGMAKQLSTQLHFDDTGLSAEVDMQIAMKEMAFNKDQDAYLEDSKLIGKPRIQIQNGILSFDPFDLQINDEFFVFNGVFDTKKEIISKLVLENKNTRWEKIFPLLSSSIQKQVSPYLIQNPFYTKTIIKGLFRRAEPVTVDIDFNIKENEVKVFHNDFDRVNLKGRFVNRIFDNKLVDPEGKKGITLEIRQLAADYQSFQLKTQNAFIVAVPKSPPKLVAALQVHGKAEDISKWLSSDQFFFYNGHFDLSAQVNGPINNFNQLMITSNASLDLEGINVYYKPADVIFPFQRLTLIKKSGDADFQLLSSTPGEGNHFQLMGLLQNLPALLIKLKGQHVRSQVDLIANKMSWRDFVDWFGKKDIVQTKSEEQKKRTMKQTIRGIQNKFQPNFSLNIDTLSYYDLLQIDNFFTNIYFEDENHLVLEKTSFGYDKGTVEFSARLDISDSLQTPFEFELHTSNLNLEKLLPSLNYFNIQLLTNLGRLPEDLNLIAKHRGIIDDQTGLMPNTSTGEISFEIKDGKFLAGKITYEPDLTLKKDSFSNTSFTTADVHLEGDPSVFNDFLKTEQFFFSQGRFFLDFDYRDDPANLEQVLNSSNAKLKIRNSSVHYKPSGVDFPLTKIDMLLKSDVADFDFFLRSDSLQKEIQLKGIIHNLSELVVGKTGKSIKTNVNVTSPKIIWNQFFHLFIPSAPEFDPVKERNLNTLKTTIKGIFGTFDPSISAQLDTLVFTDKFFVEDFNTGIHMADSNNLILEETTINFYNGSVSVDGQFDLNTTGPLPFNTNIQTKELNVEKLLSSLNYVGLPSLRSIKKLSGRITMDMNLSGLIAEDGKGLIHEATKGFLDFQLNDVELSGMEPLDFLAEKIHMKDRFAELHFAPIENRITIDGQQIEIPLMEIQSNAINIFMEGTLSYGDQTNIWITIPLDNLKKADLSIIAQKQGYAAAKSKIYYEVTSDIAGNNNFKLRLSKRKFYKSRGIISQYRKDKRKYRKIRKDLKKQTQH